MVLTKMLGLGPREPTRKDLAAQAAQVRKDIEKLSREISASAIEYARNSTIEKKNTDTPVPTSA